jgi:hypothetical protein
VRIIYNQLFTQLLKKLFEGEIDLTKLEQKKLTVKPDENGFFDFLLPKCNKNIKFRFLTGKDEEEIRFIRFRINGKK